MNRVKNHAKDPLQYKPTEVSWVVSSFLSEEPSQLARAFVMFLAIGLPSLIALSFIVNVTSTTTLEGRYVSSNERIPLVADRDFEIKELHLSPRKYVEAGAVIITQSHSPRLPSSGEIAHFTTPHSGLVEDVFVNPGQRVQQGTLLAWLIPTDFKGDIEAIAPFEIARTLKIGSKVKVIDSLHQFPSPLVATVESIAPLMAQTGTQMTSDRTIKLKLAQVVPEVKDSIGHEIQIQISENKQPLFFAIAGRLLKGE